MLNPFLVVFGVRRVYVRGKQTISTEIAFIFMSMNLTKLAKNLASKTFTYSKTTQCFFEQRLDGEPHPWLRSVQSRSGECS